MAIRNRTRLMVHGANRCKDAMRAAYSAHRLVPPQTAACVFWELRLVELSALADDSHFRRSAAPGDYSAAGHACSPFRFERSA